MYKKDKITVKSPNFVNFFSTAKKTQLDNIYSSECSTLYCCTAEKKNTHVSSDYLLYQLDLC